MDATTTLKVVLADLPGGGHTALSSLIASTAGVALVRDTYDAPMLLTAIEELRPDVVVIDDRLLDALAGAPHGREYRLVVIGLDDDPGFAARARRMGAQAWIPKERADALLPLLLLSPPASPPSPPRRPAAHAGSARRSACHHPGAS